MRILFLTSVRFPPMEGLGQYVWNLARILAQRGHHAEIITRGTARGLQVCHLEGIRVWLPPFLPAYPVHVWLHSLFAQSLIKRLEGHFDVLHVHTPLPARVSSSLCVVLTVHTPMIAQIEAIPVRDAHSALYRLQLPFSRAVEQYWLDRADYITAVSTSVANELGAYGIRREEVAILGNGVDTKTFGCFQGQTRRPRSLLAASALGHVKGLEDLVAAAAILHESDPHIRLRIAGKGPLEARLRRLIRRLGLTEVVELLGHVADREEMARLYRQCTIFLHTAHHEGLPTVLLEAMASGCAVVATAVSGVLDVIDDGVNGMLVPPRDPQALAGAILKLLQNRCLAERLGSAARRTVEERFSWPIVASRYVQVYQQVVRDFTG